MGEVLAHLVNVVGANFTTIENVKSVEHQLHVGLAYILHHHDGIVAAVDQVAVERGRLNDELHADAGRALGDFLERRHTPFPGLALRGAEHDPARNIEQCLAAPIVQ